MTNKTQAMISPHTIEAARLYAKACELLSDQTIGQLANASYLFSRPTLGTFVWYVEGGPARRFLVTGECSHSDYGRMLYLLEDDTLSRIKYTYPANPVAQSDTILDPDSNDLDAVIRLAGEKLGIREGTEHRVGVLTKFKLHQYSLVHLDNGDEVLSQPWSASIKYGYAPNQTVKTSVLTDHPTADHARLALLNELVKRMEDGKT